MVGRDWYISVLTGGGSWNYLVRVHLRVLHLPALHCTDLLKSRRLSDLKDRWMILDQLQSLFNLRHISQRCFRSCRNQALVVRRVIPTFGVLLDSLVVILCLEELIPRSLARFRINSRLRRKLRLRLRWWTGRNLVRRGNRTAIIIQAIYTIDPAVGGRDRPGRHCWGRA